MADAPRFVCVGVECGATHLALVELQRRREERTVGEMRLVDSAPYTTRQLDCGTADLRDRLAHFLLLASSGATCQWLYWGPRQR